MCYFNIDVHRASYAKHLRSKQHLGNLRRGYTKMKWLYQHDYSKKSKHSLKMKLKKYIILKNLKQVTRENIKTKDKE